MLRGIFPSSNCPAPVHIEGRLNYRGVITYRWRTIAWTIPVCRMRLHTVNENPVVIVGVLFEVIACRHVLLAIVIGLESAPKTQARDGTIDQDNRLFTAQFRVKIQRVTVEIIDGEIENGVTRIVASAHVEQLTIVNDVIDCR